MKRIITLSFLMVCSIHLLFSQPPWNDPSDNKIDISEIKAPKVTWVKESYDFKSIPQGTPVHVSFEFTNTGNAPLLITNVKPACNCTDAKWPKTPIMPGQKGKIEITFDAATLGKFVKTATVTTNAKPKDYNVTFVGTVVKKPVAPKAKPAAKKK